MISNLSDDLSRQEKGQQKQATILTKTTKKKTKITLKTNVDQE